MALEDDDDPVARYKELLDPARQAGRWLTDHERRRTVELVTELHETDKEIAAAKESEAQVSQEISAWWRQVATQMADLKWITPGTRPAPDPAGHPDMLSTYIAEIEPATSTLDTALRKASWPRRRP